MLLVLVNHSKWLQKAILQEAFPLSAHYSRQGNYILINKHALIIVFGHMSQSCAFR
jgi:hypothetical protein